MLPKNGSGMPDENGDDEHDHDDDGDDDHAHVHNHDVDDNDDWRPISVQLGQRRHALRLGPDAEGLVLQAQGIGLRSDHWDIHLHHDVYDHIDLDGDHLNKNDDHENHDHVNDDDEDLDDYHGHNLQLYHVRNDYDNSLMDHLHEHGHRYGHQHDENQHLDDHYFHHIHDHHAVDGLQRRF